MSNDPNYLSGQKLVDFFNSFGFGDNYRYPSIGIVTKDIGESLSRQKYAFERINKLSQIGQLPEALNLFLQSVRDPLEVQCKFQDIIQQSAPRVDMSAYTNIYAPSVNVTASPAKSDCTQFAEIQEGDIVVFISYAWDDDNHKKWVRKLSDDLRSKGLYTLLDDYNPGGVNLIDFMRKGIKLAHKVLVIGSPRYKEKIDAGAPSGVNFEDQILTIELYNGIKEKYIPVLRKGSSFQSSFSELMSVQTGYDFTDDSVYDDLLEKLSADLKGNPLNSAPEVKRSQSTDSGFNSPVNVTVDWKKIFSYSVLKTDEMETVYNEALNRITDTSLSMREFAALVFTLCELDEAGVKLSEESINKIKESLYHRLDEAESFDDLYEMRIAYGQTMSACGISNAHFDSLDNVCNFYRETLDKLESEKKWKLVLFLENLDDNCAPLLLELLDHAPDHGTPYSSLPMFDKVDADNCIHSIISASPNAIMYMRKFLVERYKLIYSLTDDNNSLAFKDDVWGLTKILEGLTAHIDTLSPMAKLPFIKLRERLEQSISRCNGSKAAFNL